jgi:hypothetical protein
MSHGFDPWNISLYLAKSNGLNGNPDIYEKAGAFRHLRHHHFGAVIALYVTPNPSIKIARPMGRLGNQLHRRLLRQVAAENGRRSLLSIVFTSFGGFFSRARHHVMPRH